MFSKFLPALAATGLLLSLAACSSASDTQASSCGATKPGAASSKVTVTGKAAKTAAKFDSPLTAKSTQRSVIKAGSGHPAANGDTVKANYVAYNGANGKKLDASNPATGVSWPLDKTKLLPGLYKGLHCSAAGSRVVAVIPPADAFGATGSSQLGVGAKDSLVFVFDIEKVTKTAKPLPKANGAPQPAPAGFPTVKLDASGAPTVTVPKTAPPKKLEIADLKKGTGATVAAGASVTVHYTGVIWNTGKVFDSSWTKGSPATFQTSQVIPGFSKALVGQKVGSQVIAVIPPADGYGTQGQPQAGIKGTDTLVFVVDILAVQK